MSNTSEKSTLELRWVEEGFVNQSRYPQSSHVGCFISDERKGCVHHSCLTTGGFMAWGPGEGVWRGMYEQIAPGPDGLPWGCFATIEQAKAAVEKAILTGQYPRYDCGAEVRRREAAKGKK